MKIKVSYSPTVSEVNEVDLTLETTTREWAIGRSPDSELVLDSPDVSRLHGKFFVKSGNYYFCDLGSRNGSIVNGKPAEKDRPYVLKDGDVIRIADYVLIVEAVTPVYEQAETVFRIIDPSLFSRPRSPENVHIATPRPEVVNEVPQPVNHDSTEELSQTEREVETPSINAASPEISEIAAVASATEVENIVQPPEAVSEVPAAISNEVVDAGTPVAAVSADVEEVAAPEVSESEVTSTEPNNVIELSQAINTPENRIPTDDEESQVLEALDNELINFDEALAAEATFVQPRDILARQVPEATPHQEADLETAEATFVQPRDIFVTPVSEESQVPEATRNEEVDFEAALAAEATFVQPRDIFVTPVSESEESQVPEASRNEEVDLDTSSVTADVDEAETSEVASGIVPEANEIDSLDVVNQVPEADSDEVAVVEPVAEAPSEIEVPEIANQEPSEDREVAEENLIHASETNSEVSAAQPEVSAVFSNQYIDLSPASTEEDSTEVGEVAVSSPAAQVNTSDSTDIESLETTAVDNISTPAIAELEDVTVPEVAISTPQSVTEAPEVISETLEEVPEADADQADEISVETNVSEPPQMIIPKNIVLIAHESKKSELAEFVGQHQEFFSQSFTITWPSVSEVLHQQLGITVSQQTPAPTSGGYQTIASLVGSGEVSAVIFLRDVLQPQAGQANEEALLRLCNINQVLFATNASTAEAIVHYLKHVIE